MEQMSFILLVFILVGAIIIIIALIVNARLKARLLLPGKAEFHIDTSRSGWRKAPRGLPSRSKAVIAASIEPGWRPGCEAGRIGSMC